MAKACSLEQTKTYIQSPATLDSCLSAVTQIEGDSKIYFSSNQTTLCSFIIDTIGVIPQKVSPHQQQPLSKYSVTLRLLLPLHHRIPKSIASNPRLKRLVCDDKMSSNCVLDP